MKNDFYWVEYIGKTNEDSIQHGVYIASLSEPEGVPEAMLFDPERGCAVRMLVKDSVKLIAKTSSLDYIPTQGDSAQLKFKDRRDEIIYDAGYREGAKALATYLCDHPGKIEGNGNIDSFVSRLNSVTHEFTEDL